MGGCAAGADLMAFRGQSGSIALCAGGRQGRRTQMYTYRRAHTRTKERETAWKERNSERCNVSITRRLLRLMLSFIVFVISSLSSLSRVWRQS